MKCFFFFLKNMEQPITIEFIPLTHPKKQHKKQCSCTNMYLAKRIERILPAVKLCLHHIEDMTGKKVLTAIEQEHTVTTSHGLYRFNDNLLCDVPAYMDNNEMRLDNFKVISRRQSEFCFLDILEKIDCSNYILVKYKVFLYDGDRNQIDGISENIAKEAAWITEMSNITLSVLNWRCEGCYCCDQCPI